MMLVRMHSKMLQSFMWESNFVYFDRIVMWKAFDTSRSVCNIFHRLPPGLRKVMVRAHRQAWCWQDEWYGLTMEDIRQLELETQLALATKMAQFSQAEEATEANGGAPSPDKEQEAKEAISSIEAEEVVVSQGGETLQPRGVLTKQWSTSSRSSRSSKRGGEGHDISTCMTACETDTDTGVKVITGTCSHYVFTWLSLCSFQPLLLKLCPVLSPPPSFTHYHLYIYTSSCLIYPVCHLSPFHLSGWGKLTTKSNCFLSKRCQLWNLRCWKAECEEFNNVTLVLLTHPELVRVQKHSFLCELERRLLKVISSLFCQELHVDDERDFKKRTFRTKIFSMNLISPLEMRLNKTFALHSLRVVNVIDMIWISISKIPNPNS